MHKVACKNVRKDFPGDAVDKNLPANAGGMGSILVWEDSMRHAITKPVYHNY